MSISVREIRKVGIKHEYELLGQIKKNNFEACRLPGSSTRSPDILAGDGESVFVIEAKVTTTNRIKLRMDQVKTLRRFAWSFRAEAWVAVKFINRSRWIFIKPQSLEINEEDKTVSIDFNTACLKGISLRELVSNELQKRLI